jgi:TetR/AcrR family transcriptional regulator
MASTDEIIMDAALEVFAQQSYGGATTRAIAEKAGFSELTLFRKFKNKKNLFDLVYQANLEKFQTQLISTNEELMHTEFKNSREFIKTLLDKYISIMDENIELIRIIIFDTSLKGGSFGALSANTAEVLKKQIVNDKIEYMALALTILGSVMMLANNKYLGQMIIDRDKFIDTMTDNFYLCIRP